LTVSFLLAISSRKSHPAIQCCSTFFATSARPNASRVRHAFDCIAKSDLFFDEKAREPNSVRLAFRLLLGHISLFCLSSHGYV
jgi:hypothetical protein